jgi:hypothetical protein
MVVLERLKVQMVDAARVKLPRNTGGASIGNFGESI